jgi:hypothetical protein
LTAFQKGCWNPDDFFYAYSRKCRAYPQFIQEPACIANSADAQTGEFSYVSMATKKRYQTGSVIETRCSFEKYGAPLIVLADEIERCPDGIRRYGHHIEVVAYENGVNVWYLIPEEDTVRPVNLIRKKFPVSSGKALLLRVGVEENSLAVSLDGTAFRVDFDHIPKAFHAGITACEGIDRFYEFSVTE